MTRTPLSPESLARKHREMLVIALLVVVLAFVLEVRSEERVGVTGFPGLTLPPLCQSYAWFGIRCPGCGMTRSFVQLAHGDLAESWRHHRLGWLLALAVVLQVPYRLLSLRRADKSALGSLFPRLFAWLLIALLLGNWLVDVVRLGP